MSPAAETEGLPHTVDAKTLSSALAQGRQDGLHQIDPVRFSYLESLERRIQHQPQRVQEILSRQFAVALDALRGSAASRPRISHQIKPGTAPRPNAPVGRTSRSPKLSALGQLHQHLATLTPAATPLPESSTSSSDRFSPDLRSARRFMETWSRICAENDVVSALQKAPANAGPLNAHRLALEGLNEMRRLSPHYLRRFLSHLDTLLWLDQAQLQQTPPTGKPGRRTPSSTPPAA